MSKTIRILKSSKLSSERKHRGEIDQLMSKIKDLEFDVKEYATKMRDKEKVQHRFSIFKLITDL